MTSTTSGPSPSEATKGEDLIVIARRVSIDRAEDYA